MTAALALVVMATTSDPASVASTEATPPANWRVPLAHSAALLAGMRLSLSFLWPEAYAPFPVSRSADRFAHAYTALPEFRRDRRLFESDGDPWTINVIGHGLFGADVHGRVRTCGGTFLQAVAFTTGTSLVWEYGVESWSKRPSAIDLLATPVIGAALGEARFRLQTWALRRPPGALRSTLLILLDPLGELERGVLRTRC